MVAPYPHPVLPPPHTNPRPSRGQAVSLQTHLHEVQAANEVLLNNNELVECCFPHNVLFQMSLLLNPPFAFLLLQLLSTREKTYG